MCYGMVSINNKSPRHIFLFECIQSQSLKLFKHITFLYLYSYSFIFCLSLHLPLSIILTLNHGLRKYLEGVVKILHQWYIGGSFANHFEVTIPMKSHLRAVLLQILSCTHRLCETGQKLRCYRMKSKSQGYSSKSYNWHPLLTSEFTEFLCQFLKIDNRFW